MRAGSQLDTAGSFKIKKAKQFAKKKVSKKISALDICVYH